MKLPLIFGISGATLRLWHFVTATLAVPLLSERILGTGHDADERGNLQ